MISQNNHQASKRKDARIILYTELIFVLIPFVLLGLRSFSPAILYQPDWSLAASILYGQTVAHLISGLAKHKVKRWQAGIFYASFFMAMSMISIYIYSIVQNDEKVLSIYTALQLLLFFFSMIAFVVFGAIGQRLVDIPERRNRQIK